MPESPEIDNMLTNFNIGTGKNYNKEILESLRYARLIQRALLPSSQLLKNLLKDYFMLFMPQAIVSGDFFWITQKNKKIYVAAADCTGHGIPGALMSILGISFLNDVVRNDCSEMANRILNKLREKIMEALHQTGDCHESKDGMDMSLCIIDQDKTSLQFSGANSQLYIIRNNGLIEIKGDKMPIGINALIEKPFSNKNIEIRKNDRLYLFSDGFPDQFGGPLNKKFKYRPFKKLLLDNHKRKMSDQHSILHETITNWMEDNEQTDDIMVLGFSFT